MAGKKEKLFPYLRFWRCRWCGSVFSTGAFPKDVNSSTGATWCRHACQGGRTGIADLIGGREPKHDGEKPSQGAI